MKQSVQLWSARSLPTLRCELTEVNGGQHRHQLRKGKRRKERKRKQKAMQARLHGCVHQGEAL
eukprot:scaffold80032_cov20-Tisochrysis_lutea.AAC.2